LVAFTEGDLSRFDEALERCGISGHRKPHFTRWLELWLAKCQTESRECEPEEFVRGLEREGKPDWQCRQAFQAIRLWQNLTASERNTQIEPPQRRATPNWPTIADRMERNLCSKQYSPRSVKSYMEWVRRLAMFERTPPTDSVTASRTVQAFLEHLALAKNLSPSSIAQARNALAWLVRKEMGFDLTLESKGEAHHSRRLPTVLAPKTVKAILENCPEPWDLFFGMQYGCGLRLGELLDLRIHDLDLTRRILTVRSGKGDKDRQLPLPNSLQARLERHLSERKLLWEQDLTRGWARVDLPHALSRRQPDADTTWEWQHVFGAQRPLRHPQSQELRRWRPMETVVRDALRAAANNAGVVGRIHPHLLRHCYATHLMESGTTLSEVQELMGHARLETTMIYLHVRSPTESRRSPLDRLDET